MLMFLRSDQYAAAISPLSLQILQPYVAVLKKNHTIPRYIAHDHLFPNVLFSLSCLEPDFILLRTWGLELPLGMTFDWFLFFSPSVQFNAAMSKITIWYARNKNYRACQKCLHQINGWSRSSSSQWQNVFICKSMPNVTKLEILTKC